MDKLSDFCRFVFTFCPPRVRVRLSLRASEITLDLAPCPALPPGEPPAQLRREHKSLVLGGLQSLIVGGLSLPSRIMTVSVGRGVGAA